MTRGAPSATDPPFVLKGLTEMTVKGSPSASASLPNSLTSATLTGTPALVATTLFCAKGVRFTVTTKEQVFELPQPSVAVQVTVVLPGAKKDPEAGAQATTGAGEQLSVALAVNVTALPAWFVVVMNWAEQVSDGGVVSATVRSCAQSFVLPQASVAR